MRDVLIGSEGKDDRFESSGGDTLAAFGKVGNIHGHVDKLTIMDMMQVIIDGGDKEIVFHKLQDIVNDGGGGDFTLVIAVLVEETVKQQLFDIFVLKASYFLELYLFFG